MCRGGGNYGPGPVAKHPLLAAWLNSPCHVACHACSNLHTPSTWRAPPPCRGAGAAHGGGAGAAIWGGPRQGAELWVKLMQGGGAVTHHSPPSVTHLCLWGSSFVWARRWVGDCAPARSSQRAPAWVLPGVLPEFNPPSAGLTLRLHCCPCVLHPRWCAEPTPPPLLGAERRGGRATWGCQRTWRRSRTGPRRSTDASTSGAPRLGWPWGLVRHGVARWGGAHGLRV